MGISNNNEKKIFGGEYLDKIGGYIEKNRRDTFVIALLVGIIVIELIGYINLRSNMIFTINVPSTISQGGEIKVGYNKSNELFSKVWGEYFLNQYTSLNPKNVTKNLNQILSLVDSDKAPLYNEEFKKKAEYITTNHIEQKFVPGKVEVLKDDAFNMSIFKATGILHEQIGDTTFQSSCEYKFGIKVVDYQVILSVINENCKKLDGGKQIWKKQY